MHAFSGNITAAALIFAGNLIDFINKNDPVVFNSLDSRLSNCIVVQQFIALFIHEDLISVADGHLFGFIFIAEGLAKQIAEADHPHLCSRHAGNINGGHRGITVV